MGGGENELIINTILDATGFKKGSKELLNAVKGLGNSLKRTFSTIVGVGSIFGVLSKAISTFMSQNDLLAKQMNAAWTALGNALGPIITQIINWVTQAVSYLVEFMRLLGLTSKTASQASKAAKGAAGGLARTVAGFDELNKLSSGGGGGGAGTLNDVDPAKWMEGLAEALKKKAWDDAADIIIGKFNELISIAKSKANELGTKIGEYLQGAIRIAARLVRDVDWKGIGETIAGFLNGLFDQIDFNDLGTVFAGKFAIAIKAIGGFLETFDFAQFADAVSNFAIGFFDTISGAIDSVNWYQIGLNIAEFFKTLDYEGIAHSLAEMIGKAFGALASLVWGAIGEAVLAIRDYFAEYIDKYIAMCPDDQNLGYFIIAGILDGIINALANIGAWIYEHMFKPFIDGFKSAFKISSPSKIMEEQGGFIISGLFSGLTKGWSSIKTWLGGLWSDFGSSLGRIVSSAGTWGADLIGNFWNGINSQLNAFFGGIRSIAQGIRNLLGFSEPKEGPLSDFHTYGPDMMELYARGITGSKGQVLAAVNNVAEGIAGSFEGTSLPLSAVAGGSVVPYGVFGGSGVQQTQEDSGIVSALNELRDMIDSLRFALEHMEWVAQFGDIKALVKQISIIQKQIERANG